MDQNHLLALYLCGYKINMFAHNDCCQGLPHPCFGYPMVKEAAGDEGDVMLAGWEAIRAEVLRRISAHDWARGAVIPTEEALATEFGVARATVNRALRELAAEGVLERRRKAGTRVALHPVRKATLDIPVTRLEIEGRGQRYGYRLLCEARGEPPAAVAARLGLPPGAEMLHLISLHLADGRPVLLEDRWLNPEVVGEAADFHKVPANEWLLGHVPYTTGDIGFSAANASAEEARNLGLPEGAALFVMDRSTWHGDRPVTCVRLAHAPGYRMQTMI